MQSKLALVVPALELGGGVPAVADFVYRTATRAGLEVKLVSLASASDDPLSTRLVDWRSWLSGPRAETGAWEARTFTRVGTYLAELEFQRYRPRRVLADLLGEVGLVQVVSGSPAWALAVLGLGLPVSLQVATLARVERAAVRRPGSTLTTWWRRGMTHLTDRLDQQALRRVDAIQVENPWMMDHARQLNQGRQVDLRYAPPGIDTNRFRPADVRQLQREPYVLCVGRLHDPRKNVELLLRAYARLEAPLREQVRLVLAGAGAPPEAFWREAEALGVRARIEVHERPSLQALVALYQGASAFVLPSHEEGLGIVLLEAMACGVPPIATRCGGPDGVILDGDNGFLVPLDDAATLADRLGCLLADPALNIRLGSRARARIEAVYAEEVAGRAFLETWDSLLTRGRTQGAEQTLRAPDLPGRLAG